MAWCRSICFSYKLCASRRFEYYLYLVLPCVLEDWPLGYDLLGWSPAWRSPSATTACPRVSAAHCDNLFESIRNNLLNNCAQHNVCPACRQQEDAECLWVKGLWLGFTEVTSTEGGQHRAIFAKLCAHLADGARIMFGCSPVQVSTSISPLDPCCLQDEPHLISHPERSASLCFLGRLPALSESFRWDASEKSAPSGFHIH